MAKKKSPHQEYYNPFSSWQHMLVRAAELGVDAFTEVQLRFYSFNRKPARKILGIWDFNMRGGTIGDVLTFLQNLSVMRHRCKLKGDKNIDVAFINDSKHYNAKNPLFMRPLEFRKTIMQLAHLNPHVDTIMYFNSEAEFKRFYQQNRSRYYRWPVTVSLSQPSQMPVMVKHYKETGEVPQLVMDPEVMNDVYDFLKKNVFPKLPIVVHIRKNIRNTQRNTNIHEMKKFMEHYKDKYKFIVICNEEEIPSELRGKSHILFSKDYFHTLMHDCGFINASYVSIFPSSGMANFAWYMDTPFIQYGRHINDPYTAPKEGEFFKDYQLFIHRVEEASWLIEKFDWLVDYLKEHKINNTEKNMPSDKGRSKYKF